MTIPTFAEFITVLGINTYIMLIIAGIAGLACGLHKFLWRFNWKYRRVIRGY